MYFVEDSIVAHNVKYEDIKPPLVSARQKSFGHWSKYQGKVFYDEGSVKSDADGGEFFEPGEFVVMKVIDDNNFLCARHGVNSEEYPFDIGYVLRRIRKYEEE